MSRTFPYPEGHEPLPEVTEGVKDQYRFLLGRPGKTTLMAICMNPAGAWNDKCDATVKRVIETSIELCYDGWLVANVYPEYAVDSSFLQSYDIHLSDRNIEAIVAALRKYQIKEVWAAWGCLNNEALQRSCYQLLETLGHERVKKFTFWKLTKYGFPRHPQRNPLPRKEDKYYF